MQALVVVAHPCDDSFCHAAAEAATAGLTLAGHDVDRIDLYADGFRAAMNRDERAAYDTDAPVLDPQVGDHIGRLQRAQILVFVYPTWWSGLPAILKGWLERVMVPGVAFRLDENKGQLRPNLRHLERIVGVSTYGSPRRYVMLVNDNGRRILTRALRMSSGWRVRTTWLAQYGMDTSTDEDRRAFLRRVTETTAKI